MKGHHDVTKTQCSINILVSSFFDLDHLFWRYKHKKSRMSVSKMLMNIASKVAQSRVNVDFKKGGGTEVDKIAPYPKGIIDDSVEILKSSTGIEYVKTPEQHFQNLEDYNYQPKYQEVNSLQMHYVDEGPEDGEVILMLHGQPTWSFLYRKMINYLVPKGYRCIAPDMIGMGKSDKPINESYHTYDQHCNDILEFIKKRKIKNATLFIQDWGSVIGLRLAGEYSDLFTRVVLANGDLPAYTTDGNPLYIPSPLKVDPKIQSLKLAMLKHSGQGMMASFQSWVLFCLQTTRLFSGEVVEMMTHQKMTPGARKGYDAPFPSFIYNTGPRMLPSMTAGMRGQTLKALEGLSNYEKPFLSIIGTKDRLLGRKAIQERWIKHVPGAQGLNHEQYSDANHFIQEDIGERLDKRVEDLIVNGK